MLSRVFFGALAIASACSKPSATAALRGPLAALVERSPSPRTCLLEATQYAHPFWRAPYQRCADAVPDGHQVIILDADSVVVDAHREWSAPSHMQQVVWDREVARLARSFGPAVRIENAAAHLVSDVSEVNAVLRSYCAAWRGPDSSEVVLRLEPNTDVGPPSLQQAWTLRRDARYGPLPDAVACGLR